MAYFAAVIELDALVSPEPGRIFEHVVGRDKREPDALFALAGAGKKVPGDHAVDVFSLFGSHEPSAVRRVGDDELPFQTCV